MDPRQLAELGRKSRSKNKDEILETIKRLQIKGLKTVDEIRDTLATLTPPIVRSRRQVRRYLIYLRKQHLALLQKENGGHRSISEIAATIRDNFEEVSRELWRTYHSKAAMPSTKVSALKEIRETTENQVKIMQSLGLIHEEPTKHQMLDKDGNPTDPLAVDRLVLANQFTAFIKAQFQEPLGSDKVQEVPVDNNGVPVEEGSHEPPREISGQT